MQNDSIVITAKLDVVASEGLILKDLEKIQGDLENKSLQINCAISDVALQNMQSQLSSVAKGLTVDVGKIQIDANATNASNNIISGIEKNTERASQSIDKVSTSLRNLASTYTDSFKALTTNGYNDADKNISFLEKRLAALGEVSVKGLYTGLAGSDSENGSGKAIDTLIATIKNAQGEVRTLRFEIDQAKGTFFEFVSSTYDDKGVVKQTEDISKFIDTYTTKLNSLKAKVGENFAPNISATLGEDINKATVTFDSFEQKLAELGKGNGSIEELRAEFVALDGAVKNFGSLLRGGDSSLNQFTNATINARNFDKELKSLEVDYEKLSATSKELTFDSMANAQQKLLDLQKTQSSEGYTEKWIRQYQEVSVAVKQVAEDIKLAKKLEQQDASSDVQKQLSALKEIADAYKKIREYSKTTISATATDEEKITAQNYLNQYEQIVKNTIERLAEEKLLTAELAQQIQAYDNIRIESDNVANARAVGVETARAEAEAERQASEQARQYNRELKDTESYLNKAIAALEKFNNSAIAKRNSNNADVISQTGTNANLVSQLKTLSDSLGADKSTANIQRIKQEIDRLAPSIEKATADSQNLVRALTDNRLSQDATKRLNNLTNQINTFANANKKAIESTRQMRSGVTFADEWKRITDALKSGNLDDNAIRQLTADFQNFKGEARSVGNVTNTVFTNMSGQIQMLASRWLSLYAIIGKLKTMINYVIELDDAMTKLKRVTDETAEGYERFLEVAKKSAKETNTTLVDTVEQAAKWAKSGYDAATSAQLAKTSLIYSIVGDIDNDTAVSDLVTALRGFRLEAEDAMSIVDKLDALNNKYATDAKSLGEALTVSASAMANAGNDLDETLALITGATEVTQNAKETGQAIRTITMRIRGMKGELQELGEESDGIESISKIQTQILNYTKGKVNIFDQNNEFKSTYQILKEISDVFNELSQTDQAALTEVIFGKLRANQGLAVISAFQSGQIEKALKDSRNAAGTATEEMERYAESISGHLNLFKEAVQELSADLIDGELVKSIIDDGKELIELSDNLIKDIKDIKDLVPQALKDIYGAVKDNPLTNEILNPISTITNAYDKIRGKVKGKDLLVDAAPESTEKIDSLTDRYLELYAAGESVSSMSTQLSDIQGNLNDKYGDASNAIDVMNKSLSENLAIAEKLKREEVGKWLEENADDYRKASEKLEKSTEVWTDAYGNLKGAGNAYTLNAVGLGGYTKSQYEAFSKLGLSNYHSAEGKHLSFDFALSGTLQEQLDSLIKIRDVYSTLEDQDADRLKQMNSEIESLQDKIYQNKQLNATLKEQQDLYDSLQGGGQKYNMIEQAKTAYDEYQKAVDAGDSATARSLLTMLNNIKDTLYSVTQPTDLVKQSFDEVWKTFTFGAAEAISAIDEVKEDFARISGEEFDATLKNITMIEDAVNSLVDGDLLSHEDAWKLINLDTDGILSDIELIGNQYKLNTDQVLQLLEQQINKQKESIQITREKAQEELNILQSALNNLNINSASDATYAESIKEDMRDVQKILDKSDYLLVELNGHLAVTQKLADGTAKYLNEAIKSFEAEVDAVDKTIDSLNERKDVLNDEKSVLQDQLDVLNEQKSAIEDTIKNYDAAASAVEGYAKSQVKAIQDQIDAMEEAAEAIKKNYDEQIEELENQNEERDDAIKKEKALADLQNAQNQKKRVYSSEKGWSYEASKSDLLEAQKALAEIDNEITIKALEKERDAKLKDIDDRKTEYNAQIKAFEDYAQKYADVASNIKQAENELIAEQILGSDWREKIEQKDEELLTKYSGEYTEFNTQLNNLINNEITSLQESIDAKDKEIKKIDDEIKAYNKYKTALEKDLASAKTALTEYQKATETAKTEVINSITSMEETYSEDSGKIKTYNNEMASSTESARDRMVAAWRSVGNAVADAYNEMSLAGTEITENTRVADLVKKMRGYANGGVNSTTGLAMLHGTKQKSETIFNAADSAKLYDMVHNTPNLISSMVKQASKISGFTPSNTTNSSSVNISIGQVVANNPQELTRNLDTHLDAYFRRKLTQSYVQ